MCLGQVTMGLVSLISIPASLGTASNEGTQPYQGVTYQRTIFCLWENQQKGWSWKTILFSPQITQNPTQTRIFKVQNFIDMKPTLW